MTKFEKEWEKNAIQEWGDIYKEIKKIKNFNTLEAVDFMNSNYLGADNDYHTFELDGVIHLFSEEIS